jgi:diguanylate cyclase (GGDEF)-like protein
VIFVTALNDVDSEVTGLSLGAADYITKPVNVTIARHRIRNLLERESLRREVERQRSLLELEVVRRTDSEERVRGLAFHDELTGLPNRRMLTDRLNQAMAASKRCGLYAALIYLDLDNFKPLNDEHGHELGDRLLVEVARRLTECVRETDTVARVGGDEFVVILSELDADTTLSTTQARAVAEKIRASLALPYILTLHHDAQQDTIVQHDSTVSMGVTLFSGQEINQIDILKNADALMYEAKQSGRNTIRFQEPKSYAPGTS